MAIKGTVQNSYETIFKSSTFPCVSAAGYTLNQDHGFTSFCSARYLWDIQDNKIHKSFPMWGKKPNWDIRKSTYYEWCFIPYFLFIFLVLFMSKESTRCKWYNKLWSQDHKKKFEARGFLHPFLHQLSDILDNMKISIRLCAKSRNKACCCCNQRVTSLSCSKKRLKCLSSSTASSDRWLIGISRGSHNKQHPRLSLSVTWTGMKAGRMSLSDAPDFLCPQGKAERKLRNLSVVIFTK